MSQKFTDYDLPIDSSLFVLHHYSFSGKAYRRSILPLLITAAKCCICLFWKQAPSTAVWLKKVAEINELEDLVATERGLLDKFFKKLFYWHECVYSEEYRALLN